MVWGPEWSTLIGPDCRDSVLSLVEPYYAEGRVYAIRHAKIHFGGILCLSVCCYGMIMGIRYAIRELA